MPVLNRRQFLRGMAALGGAAALGGCANAPGRLHTAALSALAGPLPLPEPRTIPDPATYRALSRLTFGPGPEELADAARMGLAGWIEGQLAPDHIDDAAVAWRLQRFDTLGLNAGDIHDVSAGLFDAVDRDTPVAELRAATLLRQIYSKRQLHETLVDFWSDHFNIHAAKGDGWFLKPVDDREVIRAHALGRFPDMLLASAHSPAMLVYLDNQSSSSRAPNENYARELLELHTLGIDAGYSQADVLALARALTGWTVHEDGLRRGQFRFDSTRHDPGRKTVFGRPLALTGIREAEDAIDALARHPQTADRLARKLALRFLGEAPPDLVDRASRAYAISHGDIRAMLRPILLDGLPSPKPRYKRPGRFVVSALRALAAETDAGPALQDALGRMGQLPFAWPTPDGYPDRDAVWQNNLLPRWRFAAALTDNAIGGTRINWPRITNWLDTRAPQTVADALSTLLLGAPLPASTRDALLDNLGADDNDLPMALSAALLASPDFQWY